MEGMIVTPDGETSWKPCVPFPDRTRNFACSPFFNTTLGAMSIWKLLSVTLKVLSVGSSIGSSAPVSCCAAMNVGSVVALSMTDAYAKIGLSDEKLSHASVRSALPPPISAVTFVGATTAYGGTVIGFVTTSVLFLSYSFQVMFVVPLTGLARPMFVRNAGIDLSWISTPFVSAAPGASASEN